MKKKVLNIITILLLIISINLIYISSLQKIIYKSSDFLAFQINSAKDYQIASSCLQRYLQGSYNNTANITYFLRNTDRKKHIVYNAFLNTTKVNTQIINIKKSIDNVYVVYYNLNENSTKEERAVIRVDKLLGKYQIIYDSSYESMEVQ